MSAVTELLTLNGITQYDVVKGTFRPKRTDDLRPGAEAFIGVSGQWQALWIIEEGEYAGQWAMSPEDWNPRPPFVWVPMCDVEILLDRTTDGG